MSKGRMKDVLIEDTFFTDERTGLQTFFECIVWADAGNQEIIEGVEGVTHVFNMIIPTRYNVKIDPRYDVEFVKREIEAAILCGK